MTNPRPIVPTVHQDEKEHRRQIAVRVNAAFPKDGTEAMQVPLRLAQYTTSTLPPAAEWGGSLAYNTTVSDIVYSNGTSWVQL